CTGVVIVKHNNPCGVAMIPRSRSGAQMQALERAWEGDPISAFGGVLVFTDPLEDEVAKVLAGRFVELVAAPGLNPDAPVVNTLCAKRKGLKAVPIRRFGEFPTEAVVTVPGGRLCQTPDADVGEALHAVTKAKWPEAKTRVAHFGIAVCRTLKSNA